MFRMFVFTLSGIELNSQKAIRDIGAWHLGSIPMNSLEDTRIFSMNKYCSYNDMFCYTTISS